MALNVEEHTITQSVLALEQPADWKALESFAEYGAWYRGRVTWALTRLIETAPGRIWHGYHVSAVDDTKVHRNSPHVWGTCTFHEYTARCPNRASTVRAHNWVVLGALLHEPAQARLVPADRPAGSTSVKSQLPVGPASPAVPSRSGPSASLAVELLREQARIIAGRSTWASSMAASRCRVWSGRWSCPRTARPGSSSSRGCATTPGCTPCRPRSAPRGSGGRSRSGARSWPRPAGGAAGPGRGERRYRLRLRPEPEGPLEGGRLPVAGAGI